jgi:hypothetical protein
MPPPPRRFSTNMDWPSVSGIRRASSRAMMSLPLPGEKATMILIGRLGNASSACRDVSAPSSVATNTTPEANHRVIGFLRYCPARKVCAPPPLAYRSVYKV